MVKVEMEKNEATGLIRLAFESNDVKSLEILDAVQIAFLSDQPKRGGYQNSNRFVLEIKDEPVIKS
jgi:hypothetical protein